MSVRFVAFALIPALLASSAPAAAPAAGPPAPAESFPAATLATARALIERARHDDTGYEVLRSLTTEVGPRTAGSPGDARAVAWAVAKLAELGLQNVHADTVHVPAWVRGEASAAIVAPWPQPLVAVALGGCPATPAGGIEAEVVQVTSLDELKTVPAAEVRGRIVFFSARMDRSRDGSGYGRAVQVRGRGAAEAAKLGAVGVVIRSVGTSNDRIAHTGAQRTDLGAPTIPALALSNPDADLLEREVASGRPVRLRLSSTSHWAGTAVSANVIGEVRGRTRPDEIVLLGAHLDSWDLGTGAHDDGAGVAIISAAAKLIADLPARPKRTIRVVLFANEEFGSNGSRAYARAESLAAGRHLKHVMGFESDLGAFRPYGLSSRVPPDRLPLARAMHAVVEPLGIQWMGNEASGGADVGRMREMGMPVMDVRTDAEPYFDLHHTANDTFDKVDPELMRLNVATYAALAWLAAEADGGFGRVPKPRPE